MEKLIAVLQANCDPEAEACSEIVRQDQFDRPPINDFA